MAGCVRKPLLFGGLLGKSGHLPPRWSVFEACHEEEEKMAEEHRRLDEELVQGVLLDDPDFLREILKRVAPRAVGGTDNLTHKGGSPY